MAKRGDSRNRMLETTAELLQRQGYGATGLNQIIEDSGAPKGSLYFHFPGGKEQLAALALERAGQALDQQLAALLDGARSTAAVVTGLAGYFAGQLEASKFTKGCPFATVALEQSATSDALHQVCSASYARWHAGLAALLQRDGHTRARAGSLATLCLSAIEGAIVLARAHRSTLPLHQAAGELRRLLTAQK